MTEAQARTRYQARIDTCIDCPKAKLKPVADFVVVICTLCGCPMNVKAALPGTKCPDGLF